MDLDAIKDMLDDTDESGNEEVSADVWKTFSQKKKHTNVDSLRSISIKNVCTNINFWMEYFPENAMKYLYLFSPFDVLRSKDTMDILRRLVEMKAFQPRHLNLIFHYNLTEMDFGILSRCHLNDIHLKTLLNRCKKIKRLRITSKSNFSIASINKIPTTYPKLEELLIYTYTLDHTFLERLISHCDNLKSLHVTATCLLHQKACEDLKFCSSLQSISLHGIENTNAVTTWKVLSRLPNLTRISIHQSTMKFSTLDQSILLPNITALDLSACTLSDRGLQAVTQTMKNIIDLNLSNCISLTSIAFKYIATLEKLISIRACYLSQMCEFDTSVEACLMKIGTSLSVLDLSGLRNVKTALIGFCCPNLLELCLNDCFISNLSWIPALHSSTSGQNEICKDYWSLVEACPKLIKLCMGTCALDSSEDDMDILSMLFSGRNTLKHFKFSLSEKGEDFFKSLFRHFEWPSIECLDLSGNRTGVTKHVVVSALQACTKMSRLQVRGCNLINEEIIDIMRLLDTSQIEVVVNFS